MTAYATRTERRFVRSSDRACLGGVCAGIADFFGFRLCAVRAIFIVALFVAFPFTVLTYLAIVFLVPAEPTGWRLSRRTTVLLGVLAVALLLLLLVLALGD